MKITIKTLIIFSILLFVKCDLNAQNRLEFNPYGGYTIAIGNFQDFAKSGINLGLSTDLFFGKGKKIGLGLDLNQRVNASQSPFDFTRIPDDPANYTVNTIQNGKWTASTFGLGPVYRIGSKKISTDLYSRAGISRIKTPSNKETFVYSGLERDLFSIGNGESLNAFSLTSGIKFNYQLSDMISIFINPQYVYTSAKVNYTYREIDNSFQIGGDGVLAFNPGFLIEEPAIEEPIDLSYIDINMGIKFTVKGKKNKLKHKENDTEDSPMNCLPAVLTSPKQHENKFNLQFDRRPNFKWHNLSPNSKKYEFKLYQDGKVVYAKQIRNTELNHNKEIESVYQKFSNSETTEFQWQIVTYFNGCEREFSTKRSIVLQNIPGIFHDVYDIKCLDPNYNSDGSVNYTAKIELKHISNSTSPLEIFAGGITLSDGTNAITIQNLRTCGSPALIVSYPISIPAGATGIYYCFDFKVLPGQTILKGKVVGSIDGLTQESNDENDLPPCVCEICENGYIVHRNKGEIIRSKNNPATNGSSVFQIAADFILPTANPIKEVIAEVISVQHQVNDPQCHTCTKSHSRMGMIIDNGKNRIFGANTWASNIGYVNNVVGELPAGTMQYANEVKWTAQNPALGVNMNTTNSRILIQLAMPQLSTLDCCHSKFTVCVRYTFIDIDCMTCDKVVCYEIDTSQNAGSGSGNTGGSGTGIGNQQNQSGTPLTPQN